MMAREVSSQVDPLVNELLVKQFRRCTLFMRVKS